MTGVYRVITDIKKARIVKLTREGLSAKIIAERMGISLQQVYNYQIKGGLRVKGEGNETRTGNSNKGTCT